MPNTLSEFQLQVNKKIKSYCGNYFFQFKGSAYTFAYATFGEFFGWFVGWNLTLEYSIAVRNFKKNKKISSIASFQKKIKSAVVARSWADYVKSLLNSFGVTGGILDALDNFSCGSAECSPLAAILIVVCSVLKKKKY